MVVLCTTNKNKVIVWIVWNKNKENNLNITKVTVNPLLPHPHPWNNLPHHHQQQITEIIAAVMVISNLKTIIMVEEILRPLLFERTVIGGKQIKKPSLLKMPMVPSKS